MTVAIRDASPEDRDALIELVAALQRYEMPLEPNRLDPDVMAAPHLSALERWSWRSGGGVLVAEPEQAEAPRPLLGFLVFGVSAEFGAFVLPENTRHGVISDLYVCDAARRTGVAAALVAEAEHRLRDAGVGRLEITALWRNEGARAAYDALGFRECAVTFAKAL